MYMKKRGYVPEQKNANGLWIKRKKMRLCYQIEKVEQRYSSEIMYLE